MMASSRQPGNLAERAPVPIIGIDREGTLIYVNDNVCELTGLGREDILGRRFWEHLGGSRGKLLKERFLAARDGAIYRHFETSIETRDGDELIIAWHNVPFHDEDGRLTEVFSIGADLTALHRAETRLERLNTTLDALGQISRLALRTDDPQELLERAAETLVSTRVGIRAWIALVGDDGRPIGLVGSPLDRGTSPADLHATLNELPSCVASVLDDPGRVAVNEISRSCAECVFEPSEPEVHGLATAISHDDCVYAVLVAHMRDPRPVGEESRLLFRTIADDLGFKLAMLEAQAMHERAEQALAEQTRILDAFFESSLDPAAILDRDFNFLRVNRAYAEADGREPMELLGRNHFEMYPNEENLRIFEQVRDSGEPYEVRSRPFEYPDSPERGTTYWDWTLVPVFGDDGEVELLSLWLRDVTDEYLARKELQQRQEDLRELTAQLARTEQRERREIAAALHDNLGQTLAFSKMRLAALRDAAPVQKREIDEIIEFLNEAIGFTRSLTAQLAPPVLNEMGLIAALDWLCGELMERHNLSIQVHCDSDPGRMGDEIEVTLFQATRELVHNALKHAAPKQVNVHCILKDQMIHIEVEDDGAGFDVSRLSKANPSRSGGFGLLNVQARIGYLGGEVEMDSEPGNGTRIRLICPRGDWETVV